MGIGLWDRESREKKMVNMFFDPAEYIKGIQQLLISDKKRIAFLCGAGTSLAKKNKETKNAPAVAAMTRNVVSELKKNPKYETAIDEIVTEITREKFNIESFLSNVEEKKNIIGNGQLNGLNRKDFEELAKEIEKLIHKEVSIHEKISDSDYPNMVHNDFAKWIIKAERQYPVEIFTTNYDYLFEMGLENNDIPYFDGFTGGYKPFFLAELTENFIYLPRQTKLWKIHGSLGWKIDDKKRVIRTNPDDKDLLIYPSISKYENSKKLPYTALMDRLCNYLKQPDSVLFVCGYSFSDEHINERILSGLRGESTSHVYVFFYDIVWNGNEKIYSFTESHSLAQIALSNSRVSVFACRNAVIGGQYGEWCLKREPDSDDTISVNLFFDEDAPEDVNAPLNTEQRGNEGWTGKGDFILPDYAKFIAFLQSLIY